MHGFDPLPLADAEDLLSGFITVGASNNIDTTQNSFYFDSDTLIDFLQGERKENTFHGFHIYFGLTTNNQIVLLIHRTEIVKDFIGFETYKYIPQLASVYNRTTEEVQIIEFAIMPVNVDGLAQLHRIDINGGLYHSLRKRFQDRFEDDNDLKTYTISSQSFLKQLNLDPGHPTTFRYKPLITGFFIGWGILNHIRKEKTNKNEGIKSKNGVKLFLGYKNLTLNPMSAKCLHLVAIAADEPGDSVQNYALDTVWSTQERSKTNIYVESGEQASTEFPRHERTGILGSSCSYNLTDTV
ncbi:hypothetical protein DUE52_23175 [Larkinella punicea]|uniref:Uncharacterized protein n=2 Tax=Larkinella punicea TaxID=2315727 RepID=A0A368JHS2_9BACT|nr:hypothetical protein DUE52_23175 [Larkinella punicea]